MVFDLFADIVKHTHGLGLVQTVKLIGKADSVEIEAIDDARAVVIKGRLKTGITGVDGVLGLSRMGILSGYLGFSQFRDEDATVKVLTQKVGETEVPSELSFESKAGHTAQYRFMSPSLAQEQINVPPFKGVQWNVTVEPKKAAIRDLATLSNILGSYEDAFAVRVSGNNLEFLIGAGSTDRSKVVFATGINGSLKHSWRFPIAQMLSVLKLYESSSSTVVSFSDAGAMQIEVDSGLGVYTYIFPARAG